MASANVPLLRIDGSVIRTWTRASITLALDSLADSASFSFSLHERRPPGEPDPLGFVGGEPVEVELEGVPLLRGYVFEARQHVSARGGTVEIGAFSASKDVVDSALTRTRHFADQTIGAIAAELCKPFAVSVEPAKGSEAAFETPLARFTAEFGDGVGASLQRLAAFGGLLAYAGGEGQLVFGRVDAAPKLTQALRQPGNILELGKARDARDRFSHYVVSNGGSGADLDADADADPRSRSPVVRDEGVSRFRPLVIGAASWAKSARSRTDQARAERARRAGQSLQVSVKVQGLRHAEGHWDKGQLVRVMSKVLALDHDLLVARATLTREADRSTTDLELVPPQAFLLDAVPLPRKRTARADVSSFDHPPEVAEFEETGFYEENPEYLLEAMASEAEWLGEGTVGEGEPW